MVTAETQAPIRNSRVLVASSSESFRKLWSGKPEYERVFMEEAAGGADALEKLESENWGEVLLDKHLHDLDANEVLQIIRGRHPHILVRVVDSLDEADIKQAARLDNPCEIPGPANAGPGMDLDEIFKNEEIFREKGANEEGVGRTFTEALPGMIGNGTALEETFKLARLVSPRQTTVLINGETGTGKELVARGIHQISPRAKAPFVVVNCAAIPEQLLEAELFGHARGAFTGAVQSRLGRIHVAQGGTLFLDEVGELPLGMQAKILRFLQDGEVQRLGSSDVFRVDVRVISATNVDLQRAVQLKTFRQDLYYRLAVFPIGLPALRQRKEDILPLALHFLGKFCEEGGYPSKEISSAVSLVLRQHSWPGNVRELQHAIERAFILSGEERQLRPVHFSLSEFTPVREI
jgi:DNA-binding NtrC family response regulator